MNAIEMHLFQKTITNNHDHNESFISLPTSLMSTKRSTVPNLVLERLAIKAILESVSRGYLCEGLSTAGMITGIDFVPVES